MLNEDDETKAAETAETEAPPPPKKRRGFAAMSTERTREIASRGGRASAAKGTSHRWTKEEARRAGAIGGSRSRKPRKEGKDGGAC